MQNIFLRSSFMCSLMKSHGVVLGWLPDEGNSPFVERLWQAVLAGAVSGGQIKMSSEVIEATLMAAPSDCLFSRKRRRELTNALVSLVPIIPGGEEMLVKSILEFHQDALQRNSGICRLGKYHDVLHVAAYLAEQYKIKNSDLVSELLNEMFRCECSFDRLVAPAILGPKVSHILSSWRPDIENAERALSLLSYFVSHANEAKLQFGDQEKEDKRKRFLDVPLLSLQGTPPLTVAVQANDVEAVKMLLQNGAEPDLYGLFCPLRAATQKLSNFARASLNEKPFCECSEAIRQLLHEKDFQSFKSRTLDRTPNLTQQEWMDLSYATSYHSDPSYTMCECERKLKIFWTEDSVKILHLILNCIGKKKVLQNTEFYHPRLFTDGLVTRSPPSLKHFSRLVIRRRLHENWRMPTGIKDLNLPSVLINYLNLEDEQY